MSEPLHDSYSPNDVSTMGFVNAELVPLVERMEGPVDSFTMEVAIKAAAREHAIATGDLIGDFTQCPAFGVLEQKTIRQDAVRARSVLSILRSRDEQEGSGIDAEEAALSGEIADFKVWQGVVVEASRRSSIAHANGDQRDMAFCDGLLQEGLHALYEAPTEEVAQAAASEFRPLLDTVLDADSPVMQEARDFVETYPFMLTASDEAMQLNPTVATAISEFLVNTFGRSFQELREEFEELNADNVVMVVQRLLELTGFRYQTPGGEWAGWDSRSVDDRNGFYTNSRQETIDCGKFTTIPSWEGFERLMVHELGVHAWRTRNGRRLGDGLLETDLPGAVDFEEALGVMFEAAWSGKEGVGREQYRYLIASYATGALDGQTHDKNETYKFITKLKTMELAAKRIEKGQSVDVEQLEGKARGLMFEHTFRAFRGMPAGMVMIKDTGYYGPRAGIVAFANEYADNPAELLEDLLIAKINTLNPGQLRYTRRQASLVA